ncbi:MAG: ABC transporter permease subunit [Micropruina sp.]
MSTITLASTTSNGSTPVTGAPRHRLLRLWLVELRKLVDTPAGVALLAVGALLAGVFGGGVALLSEDATLDRIVRLAGTPTGLLLPVLAVLLVTGERQHRTALTGYALTPRRGRVLVAKAFAVLTLAVAAWAMALLAGVLIAAVSFADRRSSDRLEHRLDHTALVRPSAWCWPPSPATRSVWPSATRRPRSACSWPGRCSRFSSG